MTASPIRPRWQRIYRQTLILTQKNLLIFYKTPISTLFRALLFPLVFTIIMCELKHINSDNTPGVSNGPTGAISNTPTPIMDLDIALKASSAKRLVFVRNGISNDTLDPIINGILDQPGMKGLDTHVIDDPNDLFDLCKQSIFGTSSCMAAVIFLSANETNIEYSIAMDSQITQGFSNTLRTDNSLIVTRVLPIQWAIDSQVSNLPASSKPSEIGWAGYFFGQSTGDQAVETPTNGPVWLSFVGTFVGPIFILILIGVVYHLAIFVAGERQSSISELMQAQMVTNTPRILSNLISFLVVYFPGVLICSILLTQLLFVKTSDILFLFISILAFISMTVSAHFLASFFGKAQLAGLYISTLVFALALVSIDANLTTSFGTGGRKTTEITALSVIFPPYTWAIFIADVAQREYVLKAFSLKAVPVSTLEHPTVQALPGWQYIMFFIIQIVIYGGTTYGVERLLWSVKRPFQPIEASSDVALRCTNLSKTYYRKRPWYWPFKAKTPPNVAVDSLNLEVKKGSVTFLLGPNGGGKTTTLKCCAGMVSMDAGSQLEINEAGTVFGICPQQNVFWEILSVEEHIKIWRKLKTAAFEDVLVDDDDVIGECDLIEKSKSPAKTLSGGQKRKLQLAIAFVGGSSVCCIDEASSGLDPLSRRNIWNIIQKGHSRRTILVTTHFLDEADILADHIVIVYKGKLVCEGPGPSLKARFGGDYVIRSESTADDTDEALVWRTTNSAEATRKILELEALTKDHTYNVVFPTLEQVFLKVTSDSNTVVRDTNGDGMVGEEETTTAIDEKIFALETEEAQDIDLDVAHSIGIARQVYTLCRKRYTLLLQKSGWVSYAINLIIPIIIAAAFGKILHREHIFPTLRTCADNVAIQRNGTENGGSASDFLPLAAASYSNTFYAGGGASGVESIAILGPESTFTGELQDDLYIEMIGPYMSGPYDPTTYQRLPLNDTFILETRTFVNSTAEIQAIITNGTSGFYGFALWSPSPDTTIFYHASYSFYAEEYMHSFDYYTSYLANVSAIAGPVRTSTAKSIRTFAFITDSSNFFSLPVTILLVLAFIAAASISVIYPVFERINNVRALQYCNGVSPFALWLGYLLFDMQFIILQAIIVWGVMFTGSLTRLYYEANYILGVLILFGIATYLGSYVLSLYVKKASFAVAAGLHILLFVIYFVAYVANQQAGNVETENQTYNLLQYFLGLTSPGANLTRALFIAMNVFHVLCGKFGDDESAPFSYHRYGSVYANLLIQIIFLVAFLVIYEYGSLDWIRRNITHRGVPSRLHYIVDSGQAEPASETNEHTEKRSGIATTTQEERILHVSKVSKFFGGVFATENISFDIASNETLVLLGGNGAGKTTMINLIRGEQKPDFGEIELDGVSVLRNPRKARVYMGVCPQDDAVDNLTVRQTLTFYAAVKGLKNISGNVDKVLNALNITSFQHIVIKALSGGTKRKLSVAVALLGNPRVILLDEPSTGQDAGAKRILWKALQDIRANRAILLTTHSMEEAEALATNVAIMGTRMLATGTLSSLQESYGGLYTVRAVRLADSQAAEVELLIKESFPDVIQYEDRHGQITFGLPHDKRALGHILTLLEVLKGDIVAEEQAGGASGGSGRPGAVNVLQDYTINGPTLEEVFMNVAREAGNVGGV